MTSLLEQFNAPESQALAPSLIDQLNAPALSAERHENEIPGSGLSIAESLLDRLNAPEGLSLLDELNAPEAQTITGNIAEFFKGIPAGAVRMGGLAFEGAAALTRRFNVGVQQNTRRLLDEIRDTASGMEPEEFSTFSRRLRVESPFGDDLVAMAEIQRGGGKGFTPEQQEALNRLTRIMAPLPPLDETRLQRTAEQFKQQADKLFPAAPGFEDSTGRQLGEAMGSVLSGVLAQLTTGGVGTAALFTTAGAGEASERAGEAGVPEDQRLAAAVMGLLPGATDIIPVEILLRRIPRNQRRKFVAFLARVFQMAAAEGGQEFAQEIMQNWIAREVYDPEQSLLERAPEAGGIGAGVGGILETFFSLIPGARRGKRGRPPVPPAVPEEAAPAEPPPQPEAAAPVKAAPVAPTAAQRDAEAIARTPEAFPDVRVTFPDGETATGKLTESFEIEQDGGALQGVRVVFDTGEVYDGPADDVVIELVRGGEEAAAPEPVVAPPPEAAVVEAPPARRGLNLRPPTPEPAPVAPEPVKAAQGALAAEAAPSSGIVGKNPTEMTAAELETTARVLRRGAKRDAVLAEIDRRKEVAPEGERAAVIDAERESAFVQPEFVPKVTVTNMAGASDRLLIGRGHITNGHWLVRKDVAPKLEGSLSKRVEPEPMPESFSKVLKLAVGKKRFVPEVVYDAKLDANAGGRAASIVAGRVGDEWVGFNASYYDYLTRTLKLELRVNPKKPNDAAGLYKEGKKVGALMPMRVDNISLYERAAARFAEAKTRAPAATGGKKYKPVPLSPDAVFGKLERAQRAERWRAAGYSGEGKRKAQALRDAAVRRLEELEAQAEALKEKHDTEAAKVQERRLAAQEVAETAAREKYEPVDWEGRRQFTDGFMEGWREGKRPAKPSSKASAATQSAVAARIDGFDAGKVYRKSNPPLPAVPDTPLIDFEIKTLRGRTTKFKLPADPEFIADFRNRLRGDVGAAKFAGPAEFWRDETGAGKLFSGIDPTEIARLVRKDIARIKEALRGTTALTPAEAERVTVDPAKGAADDISIFRRIFATPLSAVRRFPGLSDLIIKGMRADIDQSRFINRLNREYRAIAKPLTKDEFSQLGDLLLVGDSEGTEYSITHLKDQGISPKVITAYGKMRRYFDKLGRFVDQHERAMRPQYRERKASLLRQMARLRDMDTAEFRKLYGQRSRLRTKLRRGEGDPEALAARLDEIDVRLQDIREQTDEYQDMLAEADQLDAKLARLSVRRRIGYFPHKFFGSWRLFQLGERTGEGGESEPYWQHIAGPHGFFVSREAAIKAARQFLRAHPDAQLRVSPVAFTFPNSAATQMTDPAYWRFMDRLGKTLGIEGDELHELISGLARRRFRRRVAGFAQFRKGLEGYSKNVDRVIQTHTGEVVRYVMMDRLKYDAINTIEREGLSPNAQANQERPQLAKMVNTWLTDINGQKRPGGWEQALDNLITRDAAWTRPANLGLGTGALAFAATGGFTGNPLIGALAGSYVGYRFFRARARGGEFPTRALTGAMTSDMAHLKLGAFLNVFSPLVNLSQTLINTYPILGEKYTLVGLKKLAAAAKSAARGEPNNDWRLLLRADIASRFKYTETSSNLFNRESRLAFWSLFLFNSAEQFNRSVSYLGAFHRAVDRGAAHAQALKEAEGIGIRSPGMIRTQFLYSNANKPEVLRNVILRVPGQFKNFVAQEIAFALNLRGAEIPRFLLASFLLAGGLGMPGADLLDWLMQFLFDYSPIEEAKRQTLEAQAEGELQGTAANVLLRGLPSLAGTDVSTRIGLGDKFLPLQIRDWKGPWWSTFEKSAYLGEKNATMVDHLRNLSTGVGAPLKSLEAAANGMPLLETLVSDPKRLVEALGAGEARLTSAWKNGNLEYRPTTGELALKAIGGTPLREAQLRDVYQITRRAERQARKDTRGYLDRIVAAYLFNERDEADRRVGAILDEADENGVVISKQQVRRAVEDAQRSRPERLLRRTRRQLRPEIEELLRGVGQ